MILCHEIRARDPISSFMSLKKTPKIIKLTFLYRRLNGDSRKFNEPNKTNTFYNISYTLNKIAIPL